MPRWRSIGFSNVSGVASAFIFEASIKTYYPKQIYFFAVPALMLTSCVARISYLGNQFPTTNSTDVFNDKAAVKRPFEAVGKGYVQASLATTSAEKIKKSSKKAKLFGADAIVIENYFVVDHTAAVATAPDSSGRTLQETVSAASAMPNFNILFIRYQN